MNKNYKKFTISDEGLPKEKIPDPICIICKCNLVPEPEGGCPEICKTCKSNNKKHWKTT